MVGSGWPILAVQDAYRAIPTADVMYGCDARWWNVHKDNFPGEKWSSHDPDTNDKREVADKYGINLVKGRGGSFFSRDPEVICYGDCSGFQAINLAILFGCARIVLVGFDMRYAGKGHFFGDHPDGLFQNKNYENFLHNFDRAAKVLEGVEILNATPGSALKAFPMVDLIDILPDRKYTL